MGQAIARLPVWQFVVGIGLYTEQGGTRQMMTRAKDDAVEMGRGPPAVLMKPTTYS
jgi:hypothetical protein